MKTGTEGDITTVEEVVVTGVRTSQHEGSFVGAVGGFISPLGHAATGGASARRRVGDWKSISCDITSNILSIWAEIS